MWEVVAALIGGAVLVGINALTISYHMGGMKQSVRDHERRIDKLETKVDGLAVDFAAK